MKKTLQTSLLAGSIMILSGAINANALSVNKVDTNDTVKIYTGEYGTTLGGEFNIDVLGKGGSKDFISFCLEKFETINPGNSYSYNVESVADFAAADKAPATPNTKIDPLNVETKWLFWNYLYSSDSEVRRIGDSRADDVQNVIWYYEDEITALADGSSAKSLYDYVESISDYSIDGIVKALNIETAGGIAQQSQLIASPVPEPATMLLFGTGLAGLASLSSRRNKRK